MVIHNFLGECSFLLLLDFTKLTIDDYQFSFFVCKIHVLFMLFDFLSTSHSRRLGNYYVREKYPLKNIILLPSDLDLDFMIVLGQTSLILATWVTLDPIFNL